MTTLTSFTACLLFAFSAFASPLVTPRAAASTLTISTPYGSANGVRDADGANRFVVRYATADRWKSSTVVSSWAFPNNLTDASKLPLACPQADIDDSQMSEDCLSMILYVPLRINPVVLNTLVWIHGGSFMLGSATGDGLDGSKLAIATGSIVAVVQYRLGALGFMAPDGSTNLAVSDLVNALKFLKSNLGSFGGSTASITIAGQSSGAHLVRTLLSVPSAASLFKSAIIQSDPMNFEFLKPSTQKSMQTYFNSLIHCAATDSACLNKLSLSEIIDAEWNLYSNAHTLDALAGQAEPIRPVLDGSLVTSSISSSKPIMVTTVLNEAGVTTYGPGGFTSAIPSEYLSPTINGALGSSRAGVVLASNFYRTAANDGSGLADIRPVFETFGTDYIWKCASWTFARNWAKNGGTAFVGLYTVGSTYAGNEDVSFCTQPGSVCHQDDIKIVFGTATNPTAAQSKLTTEMQSRYKSFMKSGNPGDGWAAATTTDVHAKLLGATGEAAPGACVPTFWGASVEYDYQFFA